MDQGVGVPARQVPDTLQRPQARRLCALCGGPVQSETGVVIGLNCYVYLFIFII